MDAQANTQSATVNAQEAHHVRVEDEALVRGHGRYLADAPLPNQAYAYFLRSPHAFARVVTIDTAAAEKAPGVIAVLTAKDMAAVGNVSRHPPLAGRGGAKLVVSHRPPLAHDRVMHVGEAVAMVIAERAMAAQDAAELINVEYEPLAPVTDARAALAPGAPQLWPEAPGNLAVDWPGPAADPDANAAEVDRIFASAKYVARVSEMNQRLCVASMEPRGATASYDAAHDAYTLRTCSQSAGTMRDNVLAIMDWPKERLRVITEDVGGAFGLKLRPIRNISRSSSPRRSLVARCIGCPAARRRFSATTRRATHTRTWSWRSTRRENSWRCASAASAIWARISAPSAPTSRPSASRAACPACTTSSRSISA
jgi:CO/xanthine dehydrogenase Mo-binding subunit